MNHFYKFLFQRINKKNKILYVILSFLLIITNIMQVFIPILQKEIIDYMMTNQIIMNQIFLLCGISILGIIISFILLIFQSRLIYYFERKMQIEMISSSFFQSNKIIDVRGPGGYVVSVFGDTEHIAKIVQSNVVEVVMQIIATVFILIYSLRWSVYFTALIVTSYIILLLCNVILSHQFGKLFDNGRQKVLEINPKVLELIENKMTILGYGNFQKEMNGLIDKFKERDHFFNKANIVDGMIILCNSSVKTIAMITFFIISMYQISSNTMAISSFVALLTCFSYVFMPVNSLKDFILSMEKFSMLERKIEPGLHKEIEHSIPSNHNLTLSHCSYGYDDEKLVIDDVNLEIEKTIGLVGLSGEGKSTIVKLILGESIPIKGKCILGNIETNRIHKNLIYALIRYYKQDAELFDEDLEYNITLGKTAVSMEQYLEIRHTTYNDLLSYVKTIKNRSKTNIYNPIIDDLFGVGDQDLYSSIEKDYIIDLLKNCSVDQFEMMADIYVSKNYYNIKKYESLINDLNIKKLQGRKLGQRGNKVSGGEKNRIILARFLLPEFGQLYLLDEPFTNLDTINEQECLRILKKYTKGMSGILISHKMNVVKDFCDEICIIEDGQITAKGSYIEVLHQSELFQNLTKNESNN